MSLRDVPVFCPHTTLLPGGLTPFSEELNQAAQCQPSPPFWHCPWEWLSSWTVRYSAETKAGSFNVVFAWTWAMHMGFVGEMWTSGRVLSEHFSFPLTFAVPTKYRDLCIAVPAEWVGGGNHKGQIVVTVASMDGSLRLTQKWDVPGVDDEY